MSEKNHTNATSNQPATAEQHGQFKMGPLLIFAVVAVAISVAAYFLS